MNPIRSSARRRRAPRRSVHLAWTLLFSAALVLSAVVPVTSASAAPGSEQSLSPVPLPQAKRVIENVHTDAVSLYLDNGKLTLQTKADIDADGDGDVELGHRLETEHLLFHVSSATKATVPNDPAYSFLGRPGDPIWMAPQTQNYDVIWPGFSTEDPNLRGRIVGDEVSLRMVEATGPGNVELFLQGSVPQRIFSSRQALPDWKLGVPQHVHMNWVFSAAGTYHLTFRGGGQRWRNTAAGTKRLHLRRGRDGRPSAGDPDLGRCGVRR